MNHYRIRRVGLLSLASLGSVLGALVALVPALAAGALTRPLVVGSRALLEGWRAVGQGLGVDLIGQMHLGDLLIVTQALDEAGWWPALGVGAILCVAAGAAAGLAAVSAGLGYNLLARLTGGVEVEVEPADGGEDHALRS